MNVSYAEQNAQEQEGVFFVSLSSKVNGFMAESKTRIHIPLKNMV